MEQPTIAAAEHLNGDLVLIDFSDGTEAILTVEHLLALFPVREMGERLAVNRPGFFE
jgi:hypothetical protein